MNTVCKYIGHPQQLYTLRTVELAQGRARGSRLIEVCTAGGLQLDILPDAGLDIGQLRYRGVNMSYLSKNGYDHPARMLPYETEFIHSFPGGMLYTCGLRNVGPTNRDGEEWHPLHGRYHGLQAEHVCTDITGDSFLISGVLRETELFGHVLELRRTLRIPLDGASVTVEDTLTNLTPRDEEFMLLYHCNFGYPMLSEQARLVLPQDRRTTPRTEFARTGLGRECRFDPPVDGEEERVFFHLMAQKRAALQNPALRMEAALSWSGDSLPILAQWRSMASGDYALGLEPSNTYIMGRSGERENGTLPVLKAGESVHTRLEFQFKALEEDFS